MDISEVIKKERPNISDATLKAYVSNINKLHRRMTDKDKIENLDFLRNYDKVLLTLGGLMKATMKNYLVAIVVLLMSNKTEEHKSLIVKYNNRIKELADNINDNYDENEKSDKQKKNWIEHSEVLQLLRKLKKETKTLLPSLDPVKAFDNTNKQLTNKEKDQIQQYLVLYLYSGKAFPVLRNDFGDMKVVKETDEMDKDKNYFIIKKRGAPLFRLNEYKTAKFQGEKDIIIKDMELRVLIHKWLGINKTGYLLINTSNDSPMKANGISKYLNKIFMKHLNKKISTSLLRSIYITNKYNGNMTTKDKKELAMDMGHTKSTAETIYNKID